MLVTITKISSLQTKNLLDVEGNVKKRRPTCIFLKKLSLGTFISFNLPRLELTDASKKQ